VTSKTGICDRGVEASRVVGNEMVRGLLVGVIGLRLQQVCRDLFAPVMSP
jgi:hypothetical protein